MAGIDGDTYTIGELARISGLSVKTIRFWSDRGIVPPSGRTSAGYRLYDEAALARLQLVRTLRELDVDLATIGRLLARELTLAEVAAAHAEALDAQIRVLRVQRTVLRMAARRDPDPEEIRTMHELARLSAAERRRLVEQFLDETFDGLDADPGLVAHMRSGMPELPDEPAPEQVAAWVELAQLVQDADFRARIRGMAEAGAAQRAAGADAGGDREAWSAAAAVVAEQAGGALDAGIAPDAPEAATRVDAIARAFAAVRGAAARAGAGAGAASGDARFRAQLADELAAGTDARAERYWQLIAIVNGWPPAPAQVPAFEWAIAALRAR